MKNAKKEIIETYESRTYILDLEENILYWKNEEKRIELNLDGEIIKNYLKDFEREELTVERILKTLVWDLNPLKEKTYQKMKKEDISEEEKILKALQAADKNPCPLETKEGNCFADAEKCNTYMKCGFFGVYTCIRYPTSFDLEEILFDKV